MRRFVHLLLAATALAAPGCGDLGPDSGDLRDEVARHRSRWEAGRPADYAYVLERLCFCGEEARGPVRLRVDGPDVLSRVYVTGGGSVSEDLAPWFPAVDGLFDVIDDALDRDAHQIQVTWDDETGLPMELWIDYEVNIADEEQGYRIVEVPAPVGS